jgi:histidine ammonia-lyase
VDTIPTDGGKEDVVPMAMGAAWKLRRIVRNVQHILGIELMCAMQGIDYRRPLRSSAGVERAHAAVRALVPTLTNDRVLAGDIAALADAVARGAFVERGDSPRGASMEGGAAGRGPSTEGAA